MGFSINYTRLKQHLQNEQWTAMYYQPSTHVYTIFSNILSKHITNNTYTYRIRKKINPIKPWITRGLIQAIHTRDRMNMHRKQQPNNLELAQQYRTYRNTLTVLIQNTKDSYYRQQIHSAGHSIKKVWQVIRAATDNIKITKKTITQIKENEAIIKVSDNPRKACNIVNSHFATVGSNMAQHLLTTQNKTIQNILHNYTPPQRTQHSFFFTPVTEDEVISTINSLNTNSAPGLDNFDNRLLKEIKLEIAKPLTHIINQSFENGNFPSELKKSLVIPKYKSGEL